MRWPHGQQFTNAVASRRQDRSDVRESRGSGLPARLALARRVLRHGRWGRAGHPNGVVNLVRGSSVEVRVCVSVIVGCSVAAMALRYHRPPPPPLRSITAPTALSPSRPAPAPPLLATCTPTRPALLVVSRTRDRGADPTAGPVMYYTIITVN